MGIITRKYGSVLCTYVALLTILLDAAFVAGQTKKPGAAGSSPLESGAAARSLYLVIDDGLLAEMAGRIPADFREVMPKSKVDSAAILDAVSKGNSMVWIGDGAAIPRELWVGTFRPTDTKLQISAAGHSPIGWQSIGFHKSLSTSAYISSPKLLPYHNVDDEPRAEFLPLFEAKDRFGQLVGYPGVLMQYYAASSGGHRFKGSECFFFFFDRPTEAMDAPDWAQVLEQIAERFRARLQIKRVTTDYASYRTGERVLVRTEVANWRPKAAATEIHLYAQGPGETEFHEVTSQRRCPDALSDAESSMDFTPHGGKPGLWILRVEAWQDLSHAEELALAGSPKLVDRRDIGVVVFDQELKTPHILEVNGGLRLNGQDGFWVGTNYTPSNAWWDWQWRDFRPLTVADDFAAMRRAGYRIVRDWIDPFVDEQSLRAMDAAIYLAGENGMVFDMSIFTQWPRTIGFEREDGEHVSFDFRGQKDFNILGVSFRNLNLQKELVQVLAKHWRNAGNLIYNLSNETYINDPDPEQMDPDVLAWQGIPKDYGVLRDTLLFRKWASEITSALRGVGANQPIIPTWMLTSRGSSRTGRGGADNYLANRDGDIESWHHYDVPESASVSASYMDPVCSARPLLLEEFGASERWPDRLHDAQHYDAIAHAALAVGAAGAMSYEWGVSWLSPELAYFATPRRESVGLESDPRWKLFTDSDREKSWPASSPGLFPSPSGFNWGSIYHGTPFPTDAAMALGRLGKMGQGLGRGTFPEKVYVIVPTAQNVNADAPLAIRNAVSQTLRNLRQEKLIFGVLQEDCLGTVPKSARVLITPAAVSETSEAKLAELARAGVRVFRPGDNTWEHSTQLPRLSITPNNGTDLLVRRTNGGTLYTVESSSPLEEVSVQTENGETVRAGLNGFASIRETSVGITWIEASNEVVVRGKRLCTISRGRAIIASDDGRDLAQAKRVRVLVTEPTRIDFERRIESVTALNQATSEPLAAVSETAGTSHIDVDSELFRYVLQIEL